VYNLRKGHRWDVFRFLFSLTRLVRRLNPHVIHGYHRIPHCLATLVGFITPGARVVWGIRSGYFDVRKYGWVVRITHRIESLLSPFADLIVVNSIAGKQYALSRGFPRGTMKVIYNGIDTDKYVPNLRSGLEKRCEWGIPEEARVVGFIARMDGVKGYEIFLEAMADILGQFANTFVVCIGVEEGAYLENLKQLARKLGIKSRLLWKPSDTDIVSCINAFDLLVSSSYGEGFPNVIAEAMSCGKPCVVTDVGDSAYIVDGTGKVVDSGESGSLGVAIKEILQEFDSGCRNAGGVAKDARTRVVENFSVYKLVLNTERALEEIL